jgi:hypothetical protein
MTGIRQEDIPVLLQRVSVIANAEGFRCIDVSRDVINHGFAHIVEDLARSTVVTIHRVDGYTGTNELLNKLGEQQSTTGTSHTRWCLAILHKKRHVLLHEGMMCPNENFHILLKGLFYTRESICCVACMEEQPCGEIIRCNTCYNYTYCADCIIATMGQDREVTCPLCRCPEFSKVSFLGSMGSHPNLFHKFKQRFGGTNTKAGQIVELLNPYL